MANVEPMYKYSESGVSYDGLAAAIRQLTGDDGYQQFVRRLVAMLVAGNTDAHLKNWALTYPDRRTPRLSPVYDFHSLTVYQPYRYAPLALNLNGETMPSAIRVDHFRRLAEGAKADPDQTAQTVTETVVSLREAWESDIAAEAATRFEALADHYVRRLATLPLCQPTV